MAMPVAAEAIQATYFQLPTHRVYWLSFPLCVGIRCSSQLLRPITVSHSPVTLVSFNSTYQSWDSLSLCFNLEISFLLSYEFTVASLFVFSFLVQYFYQFLSNSTWAQLALFFSGCGTDTLKGTHARQALLWTADTPWVHREHWAAAAWSLTLTSCHPWSIKESALPDHTTDLPTTPFFWPLRLLMPVPDSPGPVQLMPALDGAR